MKLTSYLKLKNAGPNVVPLRIKVWHANIKFRVEFIESFLGVSITTGPFKRKMDAKNWIEKATGRLLMTEVKLQRLESFQLLRATTYSSGRGGMGRSIAIGIYLEQLSPEQFVKELEHYLISAAQEKLRHMLDRL